MKTNKTLYLLVGPPGSGKSTYRKKIIEENTNCSIEVFSLDDLRYEWYDKNDYTRAFNLSTEDKEFFNKAFSYFTKLVKKNPDIIIVDNTNLTIKRRRQYIAYGRNHDYKIIGVIFHTTIKNCIQRRQREGEKKILPLAVETMYLKLSLPVLQEVDEIVNIIT